MKDERLRFYDELEKLFIGVKVEGIGGYVNLMRIKNQYYSKVIKPYLENKIEKSIPPAIDSEEFRNEIYSKLYTFFHRYFGDSGAIYFQRTRYGDKIYERIYDPDKDVVLFWKTRDLYYIKSERQYVALYVEVSTEIGVFKFRFDVSELEHQQANEKINLIYEFGSIEDGFIFLKVKKSERGRTTKLDEISKKIVDKFYGKNKKQALSIVSEALSKAIRKFEQQSEIDYFIHKNVRRYLKEQFDMWLKNYLIDDETMFDTKRLKQMKYLKEVAYGLIDMIGQFEDELVRIWNKPRIVKRSEYVITLDRIWEKEGGREVVKEIVDYLKEEEPTFREEVEKIGSLEKKIRERYEKALEAGYKTLLADWYVLGIIDENFRVDEILVDGKLSEKWKHLPVDTKYLPEDMKYKILSLFDNLDDALDGLLIKSENYQALNTILPKWKEKVQTIYIDPPFNLAKNADFLYKVNYKDATWITMLENRVRLGRDLLNNKGSIFVRCDYNGNMYVRMLLNEIFGEENFRNEITIAKSKEFFKTMTHIKKFPEETESLFFFTKTDKISYRPIYVDKKYHSKYPPFLPTGSKTYQDYRIINGKKYYSPKGRKWGIKEDDIDKLLEGHMGKKLVYENNQWYLVIYKEILKDIWFDSQGYSREWSFKTENSEIFVKRVIQSTSNEGDIVLDFFLGSGTTTAVAHKLVRRWIGIEMGDHFHTVVLPRMKKVLFYDRSGISKDKDVREKYNEKQAGGFFKYYELESYEEIFRNMKYTESGDLYDAMPDPKKDYIFLLDKKQIPAVSITDEEVYVDLRERYPDVDVAESLSNVLGKKIEWINKDKFKLEGLEPIEVNKVPAIYARRLLWWGEIDG